MRRMLRTAGFVLAVSAFLPTLGSAGGSSGIPPETVADYLYSVIAADRTFYTIHVVERLQNEGTVVAAENWRSKRNLLPLPAQFLMESSELASKAGVKVRYRLISLWPINPQNGPYNDEERNALEAVRKKRTEPVTASVKIGDENYFQAVYADRAVSQACVGCHNGHPRSPKKDFKMNDVMGGLVIEIPLPK
ncbi:Tll0287-like domain-containing protein [Petrachloros mirabilis]